MAVLLPIIDGRECLPVRLLSFLNDWESLTPDAVARLLARDHPWHKWSLSADMVNPDGTYSEVPPQSWNNVVAELEALVHLDLKDQQQRGVEPAHAESDWRRRSVKLLPAGVFVWKDELDAECAHTDGRRRLLAQKVGGELSCLQFLSDTLRRWSLSVHERGQTSRLYRQHHGTTQQRRSSRP